MSSPSDSESDTEDDDDWSEEGDSEEEEEEDGDDGELPPAPAIFSFSLEPSTLKLKMNSPMSVSHSSVEKSSMNGTVLSKSLLGSRLDRIFGLPTWWPSPSFLLLFLHLLDM